MKSEKEQGDPISDSSEKLLDPALVKVFSVITIAHFLVWSVISSLLGAPVAILITAPLWGISLFIIAKWDRNRDSADRLSLAQVISLPVLNYWNIVGIFLSILISSQLFCMLIFVYLFKTQPEIMNSAPNDLDGIFSAILDQANVIPFFLLAIYLSHAVGGFVAGWLPNKKFRSPYLHAAIGSGVFIVFNILTALPFFLFNDDGERLPDSAVGLIILALAPIFIFSLLGTWTTQNIRGVAKKDDPPNKNEVENVSSDGDLINEENQLSASKSAPKRDQDEHTASEIIFESSGKTESTDSASLVKSPSNSRSEKSRRRLAVLSVGFTLICLAGILIWVIAIPTPANCIDPPGKAVLNYWPVTYADSTELCFDFQSIDAKIIGPDSTYSRSAEEWQHGLTARVDDEIFARVYINNGAATNAENINPGKGIARNVRLMIEIDSSPASVHYIKVQFSGDNTNTIVNNFKIMTEENLRLEVVPHSGETFDYQGTPILKNIDIGSRTTLTIGDLPPRFMDSLFIRFKLKVVK